MRKIEVCKWMAKGPDDEDSEETTILLLELMLKSQKPEQMPRGLDKFRIYSGLAKAFDAAKETNLIVLDEVQYKFLKDMMEKDTPAVWGMNPNINMAVEGFMDSKFLETEIE